MSFDVIMALDVGGRRIGVAIANSEIRLVRPLTTLENGPRFFDELGQLIRAHSVKRLVIGLPRSLDGQATAQTETVRAFAAKLEKHVDIPLHWQDEAVTSRQAEAELQRRKKPYAKEDIDALAATYILEDFLQENKEP